MGENEHRSDDKYVSGGGGHSMAHAMKDEMSDNNSATLVMGADMIHLQSAQPTNDVDRASRIEVCSRSFFAHDAHTPRLITVLCTHSTTSLTPPSTTFTTPGVNA
jgi:hypothetical protein